MKGLKPSIRERKRYLLIKGQNLKKNIPKAIKNFLGDLGVSKVALNFIKSGKSIGFVNNSLPIKEKYAIISINREMIDLVRASLVIWPEKIIVEKVSGTLKGLKK